MEKRSNQSHLIKCSQSFEREHNSINKQTVNLHLKPHVIMPILCPRKPTHSFFYVKKREKEQKGSRNSRFSFSFSTRWLLDQNPLRRGKKEKSCFSVISQLFLRP